MAKNENKNQVHLLPDPSARLDPPRVVVNDNEVLVGDYVILVHLLCNRLLFIFLLCS